MIEITEAATGEDIETARRLFREYEAWFGMNLCFQNFDAEVADLPGKYAPPDGRLYLARVAGAPAGCIALRKLARGVCEMKRLFVRDEFRGRGVGVALIDALLAAARTLGYEKIRLDTFPPKMGRAVALYESYGFRAIPAYYENPYGETLYMEKDLAGG